MHEFKKNVLSRQNRHKLLHSQTFLYNLCKLFVTVYYMIKLGMICL